MLRTAKAFRIRSFSLFLAASAVAQPATSSDFDNMNPTPGGHDYTHLSETVSPANGSMSYRVNCLLDMPFGNRTIAKKRPRSDWRAVLEQLT